LIDEDSCHQRSVQVSHHFPGKLCNHDQILDCLNASDLVLEA